MLVVLVSYRRLVLLSRASWDWEARLARVHFPCRPNRSIRLDVSVEPRVHGRRSSYLVRFRLFLVDGGAIGYARLSLIAKGAAGLGFALSSCSSSRS